MTNQIHTLRRLRPLSWGSNYVICLADVSILLSVVFDNCISRRQLDGCCVTRPFLFVKGVACETI